jgi:hypothetical protein
MIIHAKLQFSDRSKNQSAGFILLHVYCFESLEY